MGNLTAQKVKSLTNGRHSDGNGLFLFIRGGSRIWQYRYQVNGKRRDMRIGSYPEMSLAEARLARNDAQAQKSRGIDPRRETRISSVEDMIFEAFYAVRGDLKRCGEAGRWLSPLKTHVIPQLGHRRVTTLTATDIRDTLAPIWREKTSASEKALQRLGIVLRHAAAKYPGQVDVTVTQNARVLLGSQSHTITHIPAMPWQDVPVFYATLSRTVGELALCLVILTASRSGPVRLATLDQFDGDVWTIPAANMKSGNAFRIPLADEAQRVVDTARPLARNGQLFTARGGKPISDMTMTGIMKRRGMPYRPHGFRSSFRDWCADTGEDWALAETSLDHRVGGKVQRAYQRSDLLGRRRPLMDAWADFVISSG